MRYERLCSALLIAALCLVLVGSTGAFSGASAARPASIQVADDDRAIFGVDACVYEPDAEGDGGNASNESNATDSELRLTVENRHAEPVDVVVDGDRRTTLAAGESASLTLPTDGDAPVKLAFEGDSVSARFTPNPDPCER